MKKKYLVLANGKIFEGESFGFDGCAVGEIVFNTAAVGYTEALTDPAYYGQIVVQTFPLAGNYGLTAEDFESEKPRLFGYIVREYCNEPSNFRAEITLDKFLKDNEIVGLCGIDTRELTEIIRENGSMPACIVDEVTPETAQKLKSFKIVDALKNTAGAAKTYPADGKEKFNVVMIDYGAERSTVEALTARGCRVIGVPYTAGAEEILALNPDGIFLSTGAGDPAECGECVEVLKELTGKKPIYGIGLGHQLFALAQGAKTEKLKCGHRGAGQPVKSAVTGKVFITAQNHGYAVKSDSLPMSAAVIYTNVNDNTCEGIDYPSIKAFTLQFPPEACPAPTEAMTLTDKFCELMEEENAIKS